MAWKPGESGNPHGRPKKLLPRVEETLAKHKFDPVEYILSKLPLIEKPSEQCKIALELLGYVQARQKYNPGDHPDAEDWAKLTKEELIKRGEAALADLKKVG